MAPWEVAVPQQHSEVPKQENKFVTKFVLGHVGHVLLGYTKPRRRWDVRDNECIHNFGGNPTLWRTRIKRKASLKTYPRHTVCEDRKYLDIMQYTGRFRYWLYCISDAERSYDKTKLPRLSAKWITKTTRGCSFGYTDCYVLSAWRSPFSLYPTCDVTSQWHFP